MDAYLVSDHEVDNPKLAAKRLGPHEFLGKIEDGTLGTREAFWVDANAFGAEELDRIAQAGIGRLSFFADAPIDAGKERFSVVFWSPEALKAPVEGDVLQQEAATELASVDIRNTSPTSSPILRLLLGPSWLMPALLLVGLASAFYCTIGFWSLSFFGITDMGVAVTLLDMRSLFASVSVACFVVALVLAVAREVYRGVRGIQRAGSAAKKAVAVIRCLVTVEVLVWVASLLLCLYLGGFSPYGPALPVAENPLLSYFVAVGNCSQYLFVTLPARIGSDVVAPILMCVIVTALMVAFVVIALSKPANLIIQSVDAAGKVTLSSVEIPPLLSDDDRERFIQREVDKAARNARTVMYTVDK